MSAFRSIKHALFPGKYRLKQAEARVGRLEKQVESLQRQLQSMVGDLPGYTDAFRSLMASLAPHRAVKMSKRRVGLTDDGAYVMLDDFKGLRAAYSFGIGREVSWDLDVARQGFPIYQYDPSVEGPPVPHPNFKFVAKPLAPEQSSGEKGGVTLGGLCSSHEIEPGAALLKIDIEGGEWEVLDSISTDLLTGFRQIAVEFHGFQNFRNRAWRERAIRVFEKLTTHHKLIHVHGNNYNPTFATGLIECPFDLEMTFALASAYELEESREVFPGPLDRPNKPSIPDIYLGTFRF